MKHEWKVGDAYTTKDWKNLQIVGRITKLGLVNLEGAEVWVIGPGEIQFRCGCWRKEDDLIPLYEFIEAKTENYHLYEGVPVHDEHQCSVGCPEHTPVDQWKDGLPTV